MNQSAAGSLLGRIESFCRATGIAESTFGRQVVNDGKLCVRLRNGKDVTLETAVRIRDYIEDNQPKKLTNGNGNHAEQDTTKGVTMTANTAKRKPTTAAKSSKAKTAPAAANDDNDRPFRFYETVRNT